MNERCPGPPTVNQKIADGDWNYRLYRHATGDYEIAEVIYEDGKPNGFTEMFPLRAETQAKLAEVCEWVLAAFKKPALSRIDFNMERCCDQCDEEAPLTDGSRLP